MTLISTMARALAWGGEPDELDISEARKALKAICQYIGCTPEVLEKLANGQAAIVPTNDPCTFESIRLNKPKAGA